METVVLSPISGDTKAQTAAIQAALDRVYLAGGGVVELTQGRYDIGSVRIRSHTTLYLRAGAAVFGSRDPEAYGILASDPLQPLPEDLRTDKCWEPFVKGVQRCYDFQKKPGSRWNNGMIRAVLAENVAVIGEPGSRIDGQDCYDPLGEERYRGPHGISVYGCENVTLRGYTVANTGNWAHNIYASRNIVMDHVTCLAGHDGIHCTSCENISVQASEFYTGDDCVAGFGNINTFVTDCVFNTACSGLRFGGTNALIQNCKFYGPARHFFRGSLSPEEKIRGAEAHRPHRVNMLSVFTYYADFSADIPRQPGGIVFSDCQVDNVDRFLHYNFSGNERWQSHRPLKSVTFRNIRAANISMPLTAYGSPEEALELTMENVDVTFSPEAAHTAFLHAANYCRITLKDVTVRKKGDAPLIKTWTEGGEILFDNVNCGIPRDRWVVRTDEKFVCKSI